MTELITREAFGEVPIGAQKQVQYLAYVTAQAELFNIEFEQLERELLKRPQQLPSEAMLNKSVEIFWSLCAELQRYVSKITLSNEQQQELKRTLIFTIGRYIFKSELFVLSYFKPYGYDGDFQIVERMYDIQFNAGKNRAKSQMTNCLDYVFSTIHSVRSIWERREWLRDQLLEAYASKADLEILDVACGGARYIKDFLDHLRANGYALSNVKLTLIDQEAAAIHFIQEVALKDYRANLKVINIPLHKLKKHLSGGQRFDCIISAGLFDYFSQSLSQKMLKFLSGILNKHGKICLTNYSVEDQSRFVKEWIANWHLVFRDKQQMQELCPPDCVADLSYSENRSLLLATYKKHTA